MFDPIIILFILTLALRDGIPALPAPPAVDPVVLGVFINAVLIGLVTTAYLLNSLALRVFDRTGSRHLVRSIDRLGGLSKALLAVHWLASVFWLDWLGIVRSAIGNLIVVDEFLAVLPFLIALFALYGLPHGIQTRLREATMARYLDYGLPISSPPSFAAFLFDEIRHRAAIILIPVFILSASSEAVERLFAGIGRRNPVFAQSQWFELAPQLAHLVIALGVLCTIPLLLKIVWHTSSLGDGPTRQRLEAMCREQGVRVRDILVWHTSSGMLNGALIGVLPRVRYILLTDALIERLPSIQLEAVMAHEIAHARRHHLPWLLGSMVGIVTVCSTGFWLIARLGLIRIENYEERLFWSDAVTGLAVLMSLIVAFFLFGWISRKFERQADAFATQHLSGVHFGRDSTVPADRCPVISGPAAAAMQQALGSVAAASGMRTERFTFRHGSIAGRQRALARLICRPARSLPIDRQVSWIKLAALALLVAAVGLSVVQVRLDNADRQHAKEQAVQEWFNQSGLPRWLRFGNAPEQEQR